MFRYLPGILLIQLVTVVLFWATLGADLETVLVRAALPALLVAIPTALWFANLGRLSAEQTIARVKSEHERETQSIRLAAERQRATAREEAERHLFRQERRVQRRANVKVGMAFAGACAVGVIMVLIELMTLGLLTITTAGGALGGYLLRWKQSLQGEVSFRSSRREAEVDVVATHSDSTADPTKVDRVRLPELP